MLRWYSHAPDGNESMRTFKSAMLPSKGVNEHAEVKMRLQKHLQLYFKDCLPYIHYYHLLYGDVLYTYWDWLFDQ